MTTTISLAAGDGQIKSSSTSYASAQAGANLVVTTNASVNRVGQGKTGATFEIWEGFVAIPYTIPTNEILVSIDLMLWCDAVGGTGVSRVIGARATPWDTLTTTDWKTVGDIGALTRVGLAGNIQIAEDKWVHVTEENFDNETPPPSGTIQLVLYTDRFSGSSAPSGPEYNDFNAVEASGTDLDPALVYSTVMTHTLIRVSGCHVQLSDGRHVWIETSTGGSNPTLTLKLQDPPAAATTIASNLQTGRDIGTGSQSMQLYTLCRDASDNIYLVSHTANAGNRLNIVAWEKTGASTWSEEVEQQADMPANNAVINNLTATWHNVGTAGTIMVVGSHEIHGISDVPINQMFYVLLSCNKLIHGFGALLRASGDAYEAGLISQSTRSIDHNNFLNEVGSGLDIVSFDGTERGALICWSRMTIPGEDASVTVCRYILKSDGTGISTRARWATECWSTKDAASKIRILPISTTRFAVMTIDQGSGWGPVMRVFQNIGTSGTLSVLAEVRLDDEDIASLPAPSTLHMSSAWDAAYHPAANEILFWYFDVADGRRLMRTTINLSTYQAVQNEIVAASAVGVSGSTNHAIRVQRGTLTASEALVAIANRTSGGTQSTVYVTDPLNVAPSAPSLVHKGNYDATAGSVFDWTFNDLNVGDTQTAYELQIDNADTAAAIVATGKVVSTVSDRNVAGATLTNGINYRWRVRTWDTSDAVGAWSGYDFFTASAGGSLNITSPASDNLPLITDDVTVTWSVSGMTQASYRVRVMNNATGVQLSDTGFLTSTATSHLVINLSSDVEWRIEVTARNVALVSTNTATRLVTPNYNEPETPLISVVAVNDRGHVLVQITNPTPTGDNPEVSTNQVQRRQLGESTWTTIAEVPFSSSYEDYTASSGLTYEYQVVGVASTGSTTSTVSEVTPELQGVWLHRPANPAETSLNLRFGANQRGGADTMFSQLTRYAGRELPIADFAHYRETTFNVVVDIPFDDNWADTLFQIKTLNRTRATLTYRDGRGRHAFGIMAGFGDNDMAWGTQVSFDFQSVDFEESVV